MPKLSIQRVDEMDACKHGQCVSSRWRGEQQGAESPQIISPSLWRLFLTNTQVSSTVSEIGCTHRHRDVLYDDIISAHPFKFRLANQKADTPIQPIRALIRINGFFLLEYDWEQKYRHLTGFTMGNIGSIIHISSNLDFNIIHISFNSGSQL